MSPGTEPAINFRYIGGVAHAERNEIITGAAAGGTGIDAIRIVGSGAYFIAHNLVSCGWADPAAAGINVFGQPSPLAPEGSAIISDNFVIMSAPEGTVFGSAGAGIEIRGFAQGNSVLHNRIRGHARAALAAIAQNGGIPQNNAFFANDLDGFQPAVADIFIDTGVTNTIVVEHPASIEDHGTDTVVVRSFR